MKRANVTVLTTCHPAYVQFLERCAKSIEAQTLPPAWHRISVDYLAQGPVPQLNDMLRGVRTHFVSQLAADDVAYPRHIEAMMETARETGADIVYPWCRVVGRDWNPNSHFDPERLRKENYIPATTLIRTELIAEFGGWGHDDGRGWEDYDLWLKALDAGAKFVCVPEITWEYRFDHRMNMSLHGIVRPDMQDAPGQIIEKPEGR